MTDGPQYPAGKSDVGAGFKWACGCSLGCLLGLAFAAVVIGGCTVLVTKWGTGKLQEKMAEMTSVYQGQGYEIIRGQQIEVTQSVTRATLYVGQRVRISGHCKTNIAVSAQEGEISGTIDGDLEFRGQVLTIESAAVIRGDLDVSAQLVRLYGRVEGDVGGMYQQLEQGEGTEPQ